jgi:hypothetical protein
MVAETGEIKDKEEMDAINQKSAPLLGAVAAFVVAVIAANAEKREEMTEKIV